MGPEQRVIVCCEPRAEAALRVLLPTLHERGIAARLVVVVDRAVLAVELTSGGSVMAAGTRGPVVSEGVSGPCGPLVVIVRSAGRGGFVDLVRGIARRCDCGNRVVVVELDLGSDAPTSFVESMICAVRPFIAEAPANADTLITTRYGSSSDAQGSFRRGPLRCNAVQSAIDASTVGEWILQERRHQSRRGQALVSFLGSFMTTIVLVLAAHRWWPLERPNTDAVSVSSMGVGYDDRSIMQQSMVVGVGRPATADGWLVVTPPTPVDRSKDEARELCHTVHVAGIRAWRAAAPNEVEQIGDLGARDKDRRRVICVPAD